MIVSVQGFLKVKPGAGNPAGGIVNGQMEVPDLSVNPFIRGGIHLLQFTKIGASGASGVDILNGDKVVPDFPFFLLSPSRLLSLKELFGNAFFLGFCNLRRQDKARLEDGGDSRHGQVDLFMLLQKLSKMSEIGLIIFVLVEFEDTFPDVIRDGGGGFAPPLFP